MTTTGSWIARDACERDDCTMRPYQHRHLADGTPEPAVADPEMSEAVSRAITPGDHRGRELAVPELWRVEVSGGPGDERDIVAEVGTRTAHGYEWERLEHFLDRLRALAAPAKTEAGAGDDELARTLRSLHSTLVTQVRDMGAERMEAWLYGVLVGWDCGADCEDPTDPEHACDGAMGELTQRFGWSRRDVAELRRLRASVVAHLAATPPAPEGEAGGVAAMCAEFHAVLGQEFGDGGESRDLRARLHREETRELVTELENNGGRVGIARELADVVYLAYGTAFSEGIDLDAVLREVHRANMDKRGSSGRFTLRADGKVMKPVDWTPPDIAAALDGPPAPAVPQAEGAGETSRGER